VSLMKNEINMQSGSARESERGGVEWRTSGTALCLCCLFGKNIYAVRNEE
jgi:hypothetical protein